MPSICFSVTRLSFVGVCVVTLTMCAAATALAASASQPESSPRVEKPDVTVGMLSVSPSTVTPGQKLLVRFQPRSTGNLDGGYYIDFHLTNYPGTLNDQTRIHRAAISAGASKHPPTIPFSFEYTLPVNQRSGSFYVVAVADATNCIDEKAESNNKLSKPFTIEKIITTVAAPAHRFRTSVKLANLRINPTSARDGDHVTVGCDVINDGQTRITSTRCSVTLWDEEPVMVDGHLTYQMRAHPMVSIPIRDLAAGSTLPVATGILVPWNIGAPREGNTIKMELDPEQSLHEPHDDNVVSGILNINAHRPDLKPRIDQYSAWSGQMDSTVAFDMTLVVINTGSRASLPSVCKVKFQHPSSSGSGEWANMMGGAEHEIPAIAPGEFYRAEHTYDARNWFSGAVKMIITVDADEQMIEVSETNNVEERTFTKPQPRY
jgi:hypothetical protein